MASFATARSVLRSAASGMRYPGAAATPKPSSSFPFRVSKQAPKRFSHLCSYKSALATSKCLGSMLPYHTATASPLHTLMLSVSDRIFLWTLDDGP